MESINGYLGKRWRDRLIPVSVELVEKNEEAPLAHLPPELLGYSGFLLALLGGAVKSAWAEALEAEGFKLYDFRVLVLLNEATQDTQSAIAEVLELDPSQLVGLLDSLEAAGLIERRRDTRDRRRHMVSLTPAGRRQLTKFRVVAQEVEDEFMKSLGPKQRTELHDLLLRLAVAHNPRCTLKDEMAAVGEPRGS